MEASETVTPETSEAQPVETPAPEEATSPASGLEGTEEAEAPTPPDVGEALAQMGKQLADFDKRLPQAEDEASIIDRLAGAAPDAEEFMPYGEEGQQPDLGGDQPAEDEQTQQLRELFREEINSQVGPYFMQQEVEKRTGAIQDFASKHPQQFDDPAFVDQMAQRLEAAGLQPQGGVPPDPVHVRMVFNDLQAEAAVSAGGSAAAGNQEATLETGAGPGEPEPEVDPVEQAWLAAAQGTRPTDAFSQ